MKKISQVLIESQTTRKQAIGSLFDHAHKIEEIESYCAMGALMCESELLKDSENKGIYSIHFPADSVIIEHFAGAGVNYVKQPARCSFCKEGTDTWDQQHPYVPSSVGAYIIHLNDNHQKTFEEIGKEMEKLGL